MCMKDVSPNTVQPTGQSQQAPVKKCKVRSHRRRRKPAIPSIPLTSAHSLTDKTEPPSRIEACDYHREDTHLHETWGAAGVCFLKKLKNSWVLREEQRFGIFCLVSNSWCTDVQVLSQFCSPSLEWLEVKCLPFYLLREVSVTVIPRFFADQELQIQDENWNLRKSPQ